MLVETVTAPRWFDARQGLFGARRPLGSRSFVHLWPFACAWSAMETAASLEGDIGSRAAAVADVLTRGLGAYAPPAPGRGAPLGYESSVTPPRGPGGDVFYDDNAWVALALLARHRRCKDSVSLDLARRVVAFCCSGWSTEPGWPVPGGIFWKVRSAGRGRNACANAPVAAAAARVHALTGDPGTLEWAVRIYDWVRAALLGADGLYLDRIAPDGTRAPERWTYNQGSMIGAGVLLAEATGERRFLDDAVATSRAALAHYGVEVLVRSHGPAFNAIFFRNLFLLDLAAPDPRIPALAAAYGDAAWEQRPRSPSLLARARVDRTTAAPLVELYALLAGAVPHP